MCFSATASFISSAILAVAGVVTLRTSKTVSQSLFASIPIIFSVQQFSEGITWLGLSNSSWSSYSPHSTLFFLIIAQIVWPIWVPLSIALLEKNEKRKRILVALTALGASISIWIGYCLFTYSFHSEIDGHHISYVLDFPNSIHLFGGISYFIATVFPPFISTVKKMPMLGALILFSYIVTSIFYENYVISVWCFLAAIISVVVYFIMREVNK